MDEIHWLSLGQLEGDRDDAPGRRARGRDGRAGQAPADVSGIVPDLKLMGLLARLAFQNTDSLIGAVADAFGREGITLLSSVAFLDGEMARRGETRRSRGGTRGATSRTGRASRACSPAWTSGRQPWSRTAPPWRSRRWRAPTKPSAAGRIAGRGTTVVKVAKPHQDMRFDVPVVVAWTLDTMPRPARACWRSTPGARSGSTGRCSSSGRMRSAWRSWGLEPGRGGETEEWVTTAVKGGSGRRGRAGRHHARVWPSAGGRLIGVRDIERRARRRWSRLTAAASSPTRRPCSPRRASRSRCRRWTTTRSPAGPRAGPGRAAREADHRDPGGGRRPPGARRGARRVLQVGHIERFNPATMPCSGREGRPVRRGAPPGLLLAPQPGRGGGARPHDPRPGYRPRARRLRARPGRGGGGPGVRRAWTSRTPGCASPPGDREHDRQPRLGREGAQVPGVRPPDLRLRRLHRARGAGLPAGAGRVRTAPDRHRPAGAPTRSRCGCRSRRLPRRS